MDSSTNYFLNINLEDIVCLSQIDTHVNSILIRAQFYIKSVGHVNHALDMYYIFWKLWSSKNV